MYRAMLVDDDVAVLKFLEQFIPWEQLGFELAGAYSDGQDALDACGGDYPELIITDIGMPGLDGLGFIRRAQADAAKSRFVILSCHDDLRYAQQAVQLGVQDYMLKETLSPEGLTGIIERVRGKIDDDLRQRVEVDRLQHQEQRSRSAAKEKWLRSLLDAPALEDATLPEQLRRFGLQSQQGQQGQFIPVLGSAFRFQEAIARYRKEEIVKFIVENLAEEVLQDEPNALFVGYSGQAFFLLYAFKNDLARNPNDHAALLASRLQRALSRYLKLDYSMIVGVRAEGAAALTRQLPELLDASEALFYADDPTVAKLRELERRPGGGDDPFAYYYDCAEPFNRLLLEGGGDAEAVVERFVGFVRDKSFQPSYVKQLVWKMALDLQLKLKLGMAYDKERVQQEIWRMKNIGELRDWLAQFLREAVAQFERISKRSKKTEIVDAQKFVQLHLNRKITLEEAAEHLHLNPSYFSRLYKKETGENFIEYVTRMKMERAKELLGESGRTVEETALSLGYENKSYFVKVFKQHYGQSPSRI